MDLKMMYQKLNGGRKLLDVRCDVIPLKTAIPNINPTNASIQNADERGNKE